MENLNLPFECINISHEFHAHINDDGLIPLNGVMMLILGTGGHASADIDGKHYSMKESEIFVLAPSRFAHMGERSDDFRALGIIFEFEFYQKIAKGVLDMGMGLQLAQQPHKELTQKQYQNMKTLIEGLMERIDIETKELALMPEELRDARRLVLRELIISLGTTLAYEVLNIYLTNYSFSPIRLTRRDEVMQNFFALVFENFREHRELAFYADRLYLSPRYLAALVKQSSGRSPAEWINERVMGEAKQMLTYSDLSVKQIAQQLNFPNQSFFGKYFRHHAGLSPLKYREKGRSL